MVRLKVKHINSAQRIIRIEQPKGRKDRHVMLSAETFDLLREWWKARLSRHDAGAESRICHRPLSILNVDLSSIRDGYVAPAYAIVLLHS
jgi:integrase